MWRWTAGVRWALCIVIAATLTTSQSNSEYHDWHDFSYTTESTSDDYEHGVYPNCNNVYTCLMQDIQLEATDVLPFQHTHFVRFECLRCRLHAVPFGLLHNNPHLYDLILAEAHIEQLTVRDLLGALALRTLDLSGNGLQRLVDWQFAGAARLHTLRLSANRIASVASRAFESNAELAELYLDGNLLRQLAVRMPPSLRVLHVQRNRLEGSAELWRLVAEQDWSCNELSSMTIENESTHNTTADAAASSVPDNDITHLNVSHNRLSSHMPFTQLQYLRSLDLSANGAIGDYTVSSFVRLGQLEALYLRGTALHARHFVYGLFTVQSARLQTLDIGANRLGRIHWPVLQTLGALQRLLVDGNGLHELTASPAWLRQLHEIGLAQNAFNCTYLTQLLHSLQSHTDDSLSWGYPLERVYVDPAAIVHNASNVHGIACDGTAAHMEATAAVTASEPMIVQQSRDDDDDNEPRRDRRFERPMESLTTALQLFAVLTVAVLAVLMVLLIRWAATVGRQMFRDGSADRTDRRWLRVVATSGSNGASAGAAAEGASASSEPMEHQPLV